MIHPTDRHGLNLNPNELVRMLRTYGREWDLYGTGITVSTSNTTTPFTAVTKNHIVFITDINLASDVNLRFNLRFSPFSEWDDYNGSDGIADEFYGRSRVLAGADWSPPNLIPGAIFYGDGGGVRIQHQGSGAGLLEVGLWGYEIDKSWFFKSASPRDILMCVGDSRNWTVANNTYINQLQNTLESDGYGTLVSNKGKGGSTTTENNRIKEEWWGQTEPDVIVFWQGINDIPASISAATTKQNLKDQIIFAQKYKTSKVFVIGEPTVADAAYTAGLPALRQAQIDACAETGAIYVQTDDLWTTGEIGTYMAGSAPLIHPNDAGQALIAARVRTALRNANIYA